MKLSEQNIGFIGGGQMAEAIFGGLIASGVVQASRITVCDVSEQRLRDLSERFGVHTAPNNAHSNEGATAVANSCGILFLAVKPQYLRPVLESLGPHIRPDQLVISIVGGATLALLESFIKAPVVRVMPNTPMLVREGAAGIAAGGLCTPDHTALAEEVFSLMGIAYVLPESLIDPLNSVSGCGPAYAFVFMEAMADGGVAMGLPRDMAYRLAAQTLLGSAKMLLEGGHPGRLKDNVCSPGGSTIVGVHALEKGCFRGTVMNAVEAGMNRMLEVGKNI